MSICDANCLAGRSTGILCTYNYMSVTVAKYASICLPVTWIMVCNKSYPSCMAINPNISFSADSKYFNSRSDWQSDADLNYVININHGTIEMKNG